MAAGTMAITGDCGVRTGADALKLLALGAYAVLVGRPLVFGGSEALILGRLRDELVQPCSSPARRM